MARDNLYKLKKVVFTPAFFLVISCNQSSLESGLEFAGDNRAELEKVIAHYSKNSEDSLKLKSAYFLIRNMRYHYTAEVEAQNAYYRKVDSINNLGLKPFEIRERIRKMHKTLNFSFEHNDKKDIQEISAEYLIENIDQAVDEWQYGLWANHVAFEFET